MFCKLFDSETFGQILVMREYEDEQEKVKFMISFGGAVQSIDFAMTTQEMADSYFDNVSIDNAEQALQPLIEIGMVDGISC